MKYINNTFIRCSYTVQLIINFTHACREHACVCTLMACNFVNYREYFNFARFGSVPHVPQCTTTHSSTHYTSKHLTSTRFAYTLHVPHYTRT